MKIYKKIGIVELIHLTILDACPVQGTLPAMREKPGQGVLGLLGGQPQAHPQSYHFSYSEIPWDLLALFFQILSSSLFLSLQLSPRSAQRRKEGLGRPFQINYS